MLVQLWGQRGQPAGTDRMWPCLTVWVDRALDQEPYPSFPNSLWPWTSPPGSSSFFFPEMQGRGCDRISQADSSACRGQAGIVGEAGWRELWQNWSPLAPSKVTEFRSFKASAQDKLTVFASDPETNIRPFGDTTCQAVLLMHHLH